MWIVQKAKPVIFTLPTCPHPNMYERNTKGSSDACTRQVMIEAIARQYITGSMWRDYSKVTDTSDTSNANGVAANGVAWCSTPFAMV